MEMKREYDKRRYQNMTEEQKEERREYYKRRYQNRTEEQKEETKEKRKEYNKRISQTVLVQRELEFSMF